MGRAIEIEKCSKEREGKRRKAWAKDWKNCKHKRKMLDNGEEVTYIA